LFKPFNFDIISNWQLIKNISKNGSAEVTHRSQPVNSVTISNFNAQTFYESTKENTWFNRCKTSSNYLVTLSFTADYGVQSFEISTFTTSLKISFVVTDESLDIYYGNTSYAAISIDLDSSYSLSFAKNNLDLYIYF
jgi:hypothetical protein